MIRFPDNITDTKHKGKKRQRGTPVAFTVPEGLTVVGTEISQLCFVFGLCVS